MKSMRASPNAEPSAPARVGPEAPDAADRAGALALFALLLALYTLTFSGLPDNPDAEVEFQTTRSLVRDASFALGDSPEARAIVAAGFDVAPGGPGREAERFAWFGVGQALVAVPLYAAGAFLERAFPEVEARHAATQAYGAPRSEYWRHLAVGWRNPLLGAATAALVMLASRRLGAGRRAALVAALGYGVASFAFPQARSTLSDVQATFFLALAFERWLALRGALRESFVRDVHGEPRAAGAIGSTGAAGPTGAAAVGGAALAAAVLTRVALVPVVAALATAFVIELARDPRSRRTLGAFAIPVLLGAALFCVCNQVRFGSPFATGYGAGMDATFFAYPVHLGLAGLFVAPGKGLVWMAPLLLLVPFGARELRRRGERAWGRLAVASAVLVLVPVAATATWHGAWTYGPRYALPLLVILWPAVAVAIDRACARPGLRVLGFLLALLGLATSLAGVVVDHMTHQDLAMQAARAAMASPASGANAGEAPRPAESAAEAVAREADADSARFLAIQWQWRFAAPWAHWRIAAARARGAGDVYYATDLFDVDPDLVLEPRHDRERGWRHFAWVDLQARLDGPGWIGGALVLGLLAAAALAWRRRSRLLPGSGRSEDPAQASPGAPR